MLEKLTIVIGHGPIAEFCKHAAAGVQRALLGDGDHSLDEWAQLLGLHFGGTNRTMLNE